MANLNIHYCSNSVLTRQNKTQYNLMTMFCGTLSPQGNIASQLFT